MEDMSSIREHSSREEGIPEKIEWNEDHDDAETEQETFRKLGTDHNNSISIAEIDNAATSNSDLADVANILKAQLSHNMKELDENDFKEAIKTIPRVRGHRVQWAEKLLLHNILASHIKPGTLLDGLSGLKMMSKEEISSACSRFAEDAKNKIMNEWKALNAESSQNHSQTNGSNSKFSIGDESEATYGALDDFYQGPEKLVGYPNPKVEDGMQIEHCERANCNKGFVTSNYQLYTKPSWEWCYVQQLHHSRNRSLDEIPEILRKEKRERFPGVYKDFFWVTTATCSLDNNSIETSIEKTMENLKKHMLKDNNLLKGNEQQCRGIRTHLRDKNTFDCVFPGQLEDAEHRKVEESIAYFNSAHPEIHLAVKPLECAKITYVKSKDEKESDQIQGRVPPSQQSKDQDFQTMMVSMKQMIHKAGLQFAEVWALCLYTGPMFCLYNARLRGSPQDLIEPTNRGMGGRRLPPAFRENRAECTVKLAVTFTSQVLKIAQNDVEALEAESLAVIRQHLSGVCVRRISISRDQQSAISGIELVVAKSRFDLLTSEFTESDIQSWDFFEESGGIFYTKQQTRESATVESTPSIVAVVAAVLLALKLKAVHVTTLSILKEKPEGFCGGVELGLMSTTSRKEIAIQYSGGGDGKRGLVFEIQAARIDMGASLQCFSQYPGEEEFLIPPCSCIEVVPAPRIEYGKDGKEVVVYPVRVNVNLKCVTVEELQGRRKQLHLAMFSNLIEEAFSEMNAIKNTAGFGEEEVKMMMEALKQLKLNHENLGMDYYLHDSKYLKLFNKAMTKKRFAVVKFDLFTKTQDNSVLKVLPDAIKTFPWEEIEGQSETLDLKTWAVKDLEKRFKDFLASRLRFPVPRLVADGVSVRFDPPNLSARMVRISCEHLSHLNRIADRVAFLLSRYKSLCTLDIVERAAFESLVVSSWRNIFLDCPRLSTVDGSFMPNRLLRPTRGAGAFLMVGYCQARNAVSLDLTNLALGDKGLKLICSEMVNLEHLESLFLDYNGFGIDCMPEFSEKILSLKNLKVLSLDGNLIETKGVKLLCGSIQSMDSIEKLSVKGNVIPKNLLPEKLRYPENNHVGKGMMGGNQSGGCFPFFSRRKFHIDHISLKGHSDTVCSVAWSPEGSKMASGSRDNTIIIWDAETREQKTQLKGHTDSVTSVAWSPEGSVIASGSYDKTVIIWDAVTGDHHTQLKGHSSSVYSVAWSPDGSRIASGSGDKTIITWDVKTGACLNDYKGHSGYISCVAWNPNGDLVASASGDQTVSIWDTRANCVVSQSKGHTGSVNSVSWSSDGERIATGSSDKSVMIWNVKTGSKISELKGEAAAILSTAWNPHEADLVSCGLSNGSLVIWDTKSASKCSDFKGHRGGVSCVEWNKTGEKIASGSWDGAVKVWETKSGSCVAELQGHKTKVMSVVWEEEEEGKDATIISQAADGVSITWNARTGEQIRISERLPTS